MNDENLINPATRPPRERKELAKKANKKSNEAKNKKKEEEKKQQSLAQILKNIVFAEAKTPLATKVLEIAGSKDTNYFAALAAATVLKSIKKGDVNAMAKIMELLGEKPSDKVEVTTQDKTVLEIQQYLENKKKAKKDAN
jgi:hypothetical protein